MSEETKYDKTINWLKNKTIVVVILVFVALYFGISKIIEVTKNNKDNLLGENGLLVPKTEMTKDSVFEDNNDTPIIVKEENHTNNFYFPSTSQKELESKTSENIEDETYSRRPNQKLKRNPVEVSIYLDEKTQGYKSIFVNGNETSTLSESTKFNPRIFIHNEMTSNQIVIVTNSGDTCLQQQIVFNENNTGKPIVLTPNCK